MEEIDLKVSGLEKPSVFETVETILRLINPTVTLHVDPEFNILNIKGAGTVSQKQKMMGALKQSGFIVEIPKRYDSCTRSPYCGCNPNG